MKIEYVSHSIGNNFGDVIELNEHLKEYPQLHDSVLAHELSHTDKLFTMQDLKLDLTEDSKIDRFAMIKFMLKHPKSFLQLAPFYYSRKHGFVYDINLIIIYSVIFCIFSLAGFVALWI